MSLTAAIALSWSVVGIGVSDSVTPPQSPMSNQGATSGGPVPMVLSSGANSVVAPAGAERVMIVPPQNSSNTKQVKTTNGDTGITLTGDVMVMPIAAGATLYITSAGAETLLLCWG